MAALYKINYKSDFVLTINSDAGWAVPFCIKFWTGMPSQAYFAGFDGENYVNCRVGETPTQLLVMFDDHHMPIGELKMQIAYHTTIEEFPDRKFDEVTNPTNVTVDIDGTEYQVMLDFTGETGAEIDFSMPSSGVMSVNGKIGYVTLNAEDVGAQPTIEDLATIRSGAAEGATAVQPDEMTAALATKQDVIEDLATIRSGAAAGATAVQPAALQEGLAGKQDTISDLSTIRSGAAAGATAVQPAALTPIQTALQTIEAVIPSAASSQNQLADKNFVNSSISTNTANFVGTYNSLAELQAVQNPTNNDYGFVIETDAQGNEYYDRYKYVANSQQWLFEYKVESTPFTAAQWAAIQSGITSALVTKLNALPTNAELQQTLDGKAEASDIPTALSQLSQDSTHRTVTDAEKSTWNGKQNAISDLSTIRSGAAAGATAVQPAALQEGLAAKQDTLTFDDTPTANSNNPVKSGGIKTALDAKQTTISTVNVTVDNNTGTPSGTASVSGSTLSLSFQNLKGATGERGLQGETGPRGERGLPGESGVTGDVSGFTVIQTIDPSATYGATDIAGAATVQATNAELTELAGELYNTIQTQLEINKLYSATVRNTDREVIAVGTNYFAASILIDSSYEKIVIKSTDGVNYANVQGIYIFSSVPAVGDTGDSQVDYTRFTNSGNSVEKTVIVEPSMVGKYLVISSHNNCNLQVYKEEQVNKLGALEEEVISVENDVYDLEWESSTDFLRSCVKRSNAYVRLSDGKINNTSLNLDAYIGIIPNGVKSFRVYSAGYDNQSAAIAFYSSASEQSANTYLSSYSVRNEATPTEIDVDVPAGALSVAFTNYSATVSEPIIRAIGIDYISASDFGNTGKVVTQDFFSETYSHVNVLPIADYAIGRWIRFTDGVPVSTSTYLGYYKITIEDWMKKIVVKSYLGDSNPAAIAFYSSSTPSSDSYLSTSSLQAISGTNYYTAEIPNGAVCFCVTHRNDVADALPLIEVTGQGGVPQSYIDRIVGSKLISSRREAAVTGSAISLPIDLSSYEIGTHFLLKIITASGANKKTAALMGDIYLSVLSDLKTGESYYFERTSEVSRIRLYCSSGTNEIIDYDLYVVGSTLNNNNLLLQPNTLSLKQGSIELGEPLQGKYWVTPTTTNNNGSWVCFPIQYSRGYSIHINIDFETYYLSLALWRDDLSGYSEIHITEETDYYIPTFVAAWHIAVRRIDRAYVAAETVIDALTCSFVTDSGYKWEKPAPVSYVESLFNEVKQTDSASTQVGNPFFNKPWIAHYSPNGFIKDGNGNNVIASESLADVEMAARLGFSFIEANIQPTSDGNYIVTHGSGGTFGNNVKSADESVITTADLQATAINTKSLSWIKTYVRYNSTLAKYQTTIPTLEEFCECCKENNIGVFGGTNQRDAIDLMVKHLGIDAVVVYNPPSDIRDYFNGMLFQYKSTGSTAESMLADAKSYGCPYICGLSQTLYAEMLSNDELGEFLEVMHYNGFLVGHSYLSEADARAAFRMGFDFAAADHDVNPFKGDKVYDLDGNASDFTTTGAIANNVATLSSGQTISCGSTDFFALAKCSLSIRFTGSLTISLGSKWSSNRTITSDGSELIVITDYCYRRNTVLAITATASTTITGLVYKYAVC